MPKKIKDQKMLTEKAKSLFSLRKRIKKVENITEKTADIKIVSSTSKDSAKKDGLVSVATTTLEFQHAYGQLNRDPKYAKNVFISNYDKIIDSQDFVGIDFIAIQTFIAKNSTMRAETLVDEAKNFFNFLWTYLYTTSNVEIVKGIRFEAIDVAGLIVPVINSELAAQTITKQTVKVDKVFAAAGKAGVIDNKPNTLAMLDILLKTLIESAQFGYIIEIGNVVLFRREGGERTDLALIPGREFFDGQSVMKQSNSNNKDRGTAQAVKGFKVKEAK